MGRAFYCSNLQEFKSVGLGRHATESVRPIQLIFLSIPLNLQHKIAIRESLAW